MVVKMKQEGQTASLGLHVSAYQGNPFWNSADFEPQAFGCGGQNRFGIDPMLVGIGEFTTHFRLPILVVGLLNRMFTGGTIWLLKSPWPFGAPAENNWGKAALVEVGFHVTRLIKRGQRIWDDHLVGNHPKDGCFPNWQSYAWYLGARNIDPPAIDTSPKEGEEGPPGCFVLLFSLQVKWVIFWTRSDPSLYSIGGRVEFPSLQTSRPP